MKTFAQKFISLMSVMALAAVLLVPNTAQAYFWRTSTSTPGNSASSPSNPTVFTQGYGFGSAGFGYGYGYGYSSRALGTGYYGSSATVVTGMETSAITTGVLDLSAVVTTSGSTKTAPATTVLQTVTGATDANATVVRSIGSVITASSSWDGIIQPITPITDTTLTGLYFTGTDAGSNTLASAVFTVGSDTYPLTLTTGTLTLRLPLLAAHDGTREYTVRYIPAGTTGNSGTTEGLCTSFVPVSSVDYCVIAVTHATRFYVTSAPPSTGGTGGTAAAASSGGGGGGGVSHCRDDKGRYITGSADKDGKCKVKKAVVPTPEEFKPGEIAPMFRDIANHWAKDYIETLRETGIIHGKVVGNFQPDAPLTRAEMIKIALNAFGDKVADSIDAKPFSDAEPAMWYSPYLAKAKELGIVQGYADGSFHPNQTVNRAEALKILSAASGISVPAASGSSFSDVGGSAWFAKYVDFAKTNGVVSGYGNGQFGPGNPVLRGEMAKMAVLTMKLKK